MALLLAVFLLLAGQVPAHAQNATGLPVVTGVLEEGLTAAADVTGILDAEGLTLVSYSYQWIRSDAGTDTNISGATDSTYVMQAADVGKALKVRVTFTDDDANAEMLTSSASDLVTSAPTTYLVKNLTQGAGADLSITTETPDGADASTNGDAYAQPFNVGDYGVTLQSVRLLMGVDTGVEPRVSIHWDDPGMPRGTPLVVLTNPTSIDGSTATVEEFTTDGFVLEANTLYWLVIEKLSGTGSVTLGATTATDDDADPEQGWSVGDAAQVRASGTATFSNASPTTIVKVAVLGEQVANEAATSTLSIVGTFEANLALYARGGVTDPNGLYNAAYAYQWIRVDGATETEITDANTTAYTVQSADVGKTLKVRVSFSDDAGYPETLLSPATPTIRAAESYVVTNLGQTRGVSNFGTQIGLTGFAQPFMTGSAGATPNKLKIESIVLGDSTVTAEIWSDNSGRPGSNLHTFGVNSGVTLLADTKYWLVVRRTTGTDNFSVTVNRVAGTDAGGSSDWSIIDGNIWYYWEPLSTWYQYSSFSDPSAAFVMRMGLQVATDGGLDGIRVDYPGTVALSRRTPAMDSPLTATLTDPDGVTGETWTWSWSDTVTGAFTIITGENTATYTPVTEDVGRYLKASASYRDSIGVKSVEQVSDNPAVIGSPPVFAEDSLTFTVDENVTTGTIGTITATGSEGETITYSVGGDDETAFNEDFSLNSSTGVITVKPDATIDYESTPSYSVTITATDTEAEMAMVNVTINVTDVNEPGTVSFAAQPQGTLPVTRLYDVKAILQDPDIGDPNVVDDTWSWTWSWSTTRTGPFTPITDLGGTPGFGSRPRIDYYVARQEDVGRYLKATVSYTDAFGSGQSAEYVSENPVAANPPPLVIGGGLEVGLYAVASLPRGWSAPWNTGSLFRRWIRVDGESETVIFNPGASVPASNNIYRIQEADFGKRLKVEWTYGCSTSPIFVVCSRILPPGELVYTSDVSDVVRGASSYLGSNLGERPVGGGRFASRGVAQGFTTGNNPAELIAVRVAVTGIGSKVSIYSDDSGSPGASLHILTPPPQRRSTL